MFARPSDSYELFQNIIDVQKEIVEELGLGYRVLNMGTMELGASAH